MRDSFDLGAFIRGYVTAGLWCDAIDAADPGAEMGGMNGLGDTPDADTMKSIREDCTAFMEANIGDLMDYCDQRSYDPSQGKPEDYAGHDFWLSRGGHGTGFFDRGLGALGDRLQEEARLYGDPGNFYVNADGTFSF